MDIPQLTISLKCLFCGEALEGPEGADYRSGDLIKCTKCGEENNYDSVLDIAKDEGMSQVREMVEDQLQKQLKGLFKK
ncbi:hypothetical protein [uncultured Lamprocystis sp.]|jgi:hypothetical protein|uniref:hypothetical protein n=1 Tax=uncultured Lamprocystis sp. TaxID=543132 RepID=UPI0025EBEEA3|nr:hypothetical protein [uncultured Lamprocystis sp.]